MENLPEAISETKAKVESVFMRTVLKKEVYDRLRTLAQEYSTGQGHWDFGVAIQILLDFYDSNKQEHKLDAILDLLQEPENKEEEMIELLGGEKIRKGEI